jgi:hypothetical protein
MMTRANWRRIFASVVTPVLVFLLLFQVVIAGGADDFSGLVSETVFEAGCERGQLTGDVSDPVAPKHTSHHEVCCGLHCEYFIDSLPELTLSDRLNFPAEATFQKCASKPAVSSLGLRREPQAPRASPKFRVTIGIDWSGSIDAHFLTA